MASEQDTACPICCLPGNFESFGLTRQYSCKRCGDFRITTSAIPVWRNGHPSERQIANASGWVRERPGVRIEAADIGFLLSLREPEVDERADKILKELSRRASCLGDSIRVEWSTEEQTVHDWLGISWSSNYPELWYLFARYLDAHKHFIHVTGEMKRGPTLFSLRITPSGYEHLRELRRINEESDIGFCAMWFDPSVRRLWDQGVELGILGAGYRPLRIDNKEHNNKIDDEIIAGIRRSRFLVADLTGHRGGVYFEAGFALGLGLPVVWTCREDELGAVHFDNRQYNFVLWEESKLEEFRQRLQNRIEATLGRGSYRSE